MTTMKIFPKCYDEALGITKVNGGDRKWHGGSKMA